MFFNFPRQSENFHLKASTKALYYLQEMLNSCASSVLSRPEGVGGNQIIIVPIVDKFKILINFCPSFLKLC